MAPFGSLGSHFCPPGEGGVLGDPKIASLFIFGFGPPFGPLGPSKCQNFKIAISKLECSKLQSRLVMLTKNNI